MAPKKGALEPHILHIFQDHSKMKERCGWRNLDAEEFATTHLKMLKELGAVSEKITRAQCRRVLAAAKLNLSLAEIYLLSEKICGTIRYCKQRLHDAGSGVHLPPCCTTSGKIWGKHKVKILPKDRVQKEQPSKVQKEPSPKKEPESIREVLGLGPKKESDVTLCWTLKMMKLLLVLPHPHGLHLHPAPLALGVKKVLCTYICTSLCQAMHFGKVTWDIG